MNFSLPDAQQKLLHLLAPKMHELGYYLAGGTALAIHFNHRLSVDLDWFTEQEIGDVMQLASTLKSTLELTVTSVAPGTLHAEAENVRLSFLEFRYPLLNPVTTSNAFECPIASLDDIACMKLSAIAQRGAKKDFVDLYTLIERHRPLPALLDLYRQKFRVEDIAPVLYGLVYFDDADNEPMPPLWQTEWKVIAQSFRKWVKKIDQGSPSNS